jgi:hypothetical protein
MANGGFTAVWPYGQVHRMRFLFSEILLVFSRLLISDRIKLSWALNDHTKRKCLELKPAKNAIFWGGPGGGSES